MPLTSGQCLLVKNRQANWRFCRLGRVPRAYLGVFTMPWESLAEVTPNKEYIAVVTWGTNWLDKFYTWLYYAENIRNRLRKSKGIMGYSFRSQSKPNQMWTLSVWEDAEPLMRFVRGSLHSKARVDLKPGAGGKFKWARWSIQGSSVPPSWEDAIGRVAKS